MRALLGILISFVRPNRYWPIPVCLRQHLYLYPTTVLAPSTDLGSVSTEPLEVKAVNNDAGFTQVVDGRGREGWIKNSELQAEISPASACPRFRKSWMRPMPVC